MIANFRYIEKLWHSENFAGIANILLCHREIHCSPMLDPAATVPLATVPCIYCSIGHCSLHPASCILQLAIFLFSSLLSSWSLIYDVEFDSNSSCLDRLNNVGMISSQKLKNLPQNAISGIVGTLMCKSG